MIHRREIISLPLAPSLRQKLIASGFHTVADLDGVGPVDLSTGAQIVPDVLMFESTGVLVVF
jgi:hypothetical protein